MTIECLPIGAFQPLLDEAKRIADPMPILVLDGPIGSYGFRSGWWTVQRGDEVAKCFSSVSHHADLETQHDHVRHSAAVGFAIRDLRRAGFLEEKPK
jgi:hypothetical protein